MSQDWDLASEMSRKSSLRDEAMIFDDYDGFHLCGRFWLGTSLLNARCSHCLQYLASWVKGFMAVDFDKINVGGAKAVGGRIGSCNFLGVCDNQ